MIIKLIYLYCDRWDALYRISKSNNPHTKKDAYKWLAKTNKEIIKLEGLIYGTRK